MQSERERAVERPPEYAGRVAASTWAVAGGVLGLLGVVMGAAGAHALEGRIAAESLDTIETAVRFQMYHAIALVALGGLGRVWRTRVVMLSGALLLLGTVVFCGSLYLLALLDIGVSGAVAPVGGLSLMAGWATLAVGGVVDYRKARKWRETMITGMNHTGFVVNDIDTSAEFYKSVVGLQEVARRERDGGPISQVLGYENTHIKVALLGFEGESGHVLELVQYIRPPVGERPSEERAVLGASHICFTVSDIEAAFEGAVGQWRQEAESAGGGSAGTQSLLPARPGRQLGRAPRDRGVIGGIANGG